MSDSDTPETDETASYEGNWDTKALRMTHHARRLERERDEFKARLKELERELYEIHECFQSDGLEGEGVKPKGAK